MPLPATRRLPTLQGRIEEVLGDKAVVLDQFGVRRTISTRVRGTKSDPPRVGEVWYVDRPYGDWSLVACVQADWAWEPWDPAFFPPSTTYTVVADPQNRTLWTRSGNTVTVDCSMKLLLSTTTAAVGVSLPLPALRSRVPFSGDAMGALCRCTVEADLDRVWLRPVTNFFSGPGVFSFAGTYEVAP